MIHSLNQYFKSRLAWSMLALTAFLLEIIALWLQYGIGLNPCILCIYERCALFGVIGAGLIGAILPNNTPLRYTALIIWIYSAWKGIKISWKHFIILTYPIPFMTCDFSIRFPVWFPLDTWFPQIFAPTGDCLMRQWKFLMLDISQWLVIIFIIYFCIALSILIIQFSTFKRYSSFIRQ